MAIELITFYSFIGTAIVFLIFTPLFAKKPILESSKKKDLVDFYYENIQSLAVFVSLFVIAFSLLIIDSDATECDSSYTPLLWWVLIFFPLPTLIPLLKIKWLSIALSLITLGAMIYVPIQYVFTEGC